MFQHQAPCPGKYPQAPRYSVGDEGYQALLWGGGTYALRYNQWLNRPPPLQPARRKYIICGETGIGDISVTIIFVWVGRERTIRRLC